MDLYAELQAGGPLVNKLEGLALELQAIETELGSSAPYSQKCSRVVYDIFRECGYNFGFLVPFFFPEFLRAKTDDDEKHKKPLSLLNRPFAFCLTGLNIGGETTVRASRQVSKSTNFCARQLILPHLLSGWRSLYIAPHTEHMRTYQNRLREMERLFRYYQQHPNYRQNLAYKEYPNQSAIELTRVHESASDIRGKSADEVLWDEAQNFDPSFLPEVEQVLRVSEVPCKLIAGTSLTIETFLETKYQQGSQGQWHIFCERCRSWWNCSDEEQVLPMIQPEGLACPHCVEKYKEFQPLDASIGQYVHAYESRKDQGYESYHIPQIIIPDFVNDAVQWNKIYRALQDYTQMGQLKKFLQEILGIPTEEGVREITEDDLKRMCCLPETKQALLAKAQRGFYKYIVSGVDWGGSDWNPGDKTKLSYTFHAILGVTPDNAFDIIHMRKYSGMDYTSILRFIAEDHRKYRGGFMASDFSAGSLYNLMLRDQQGVKASTHLILGYGGPETSVFSRPAHSELLNHFSVNKTESITHLFSFVKMERPRLRCYNWNDAREFLLDFLNLFRSPIETASGRSIMRYRRHGSKADDGLHAVNFALLLSRILLQEPLIEDRGLKSELEKRLRTYASATNFTGGSNVVSG